jgi:Domain of unknown function (DUF4412)
MKKIFASALLIFAGVLAVSAQSFEGIIEFKKQTASDTLNYIYYVKNDKVRLDEIGSRSKKAEGSFIIDLNAQSLIALNHERKLYSEQKSAGTPAVVTGKSDVKRTGNVKTIQGMKCAEYIVKNADEKMQVSYWMASNNFDFFFKLLKVLNRKDKSAVYIQQITGAKGMFPFLSVQFNLETNKEEVKMEVTKIEKKIIDASKFEIPRDYQKFEK